MYLKLIKGVWFDVQCFYIYFMENGKKEKKNKQKEIMDKLVLFQNDHFSGAWLMFRGPQEYSKLQFVVYCTC